TSKRRRLYSLVEAPLTMLTALYLAGIGLHDRFVLTLLIVGRRGAFSFMNVIYLRRGSIYVVGALCASTACASTGSFLAAIVAAIVGAGLYGLIVELLVIRHLYRRDHLDQVLATLGLILFTNELVSVVFGRSPPFMNIPSFLSGSVQVLPG